MDTSRIIFFGTPTFALNSLEAILKSGRTVSLVVTQPDRPKGRGQRVESSPVKRFSDEHGLPVIQPLKMKDIAFHGVLKDQSSNIFVVAAYGRILPNKVLEIPTHVLNVHASLLPRWRGASPIQRAIQAGDSTTGISIIELVEELDAGDVLLQKSLEIDPSETKGELENRLGALGGRTIVEALDQLEKDQAHFLQQDPAFVTLAPPVLPEEGIINWSEPASTIHNLVRAFQPWPGTYTRDRGSRIKIHRTALTHMTTSFEPGTFWAEKERLFVACGRGVLEILELQREGKKNQPAKQFLLGYHFETGAIWRS